MSWKVKTLIKISPCYLYVVLVCAQNAAISMTNVGVTKCYNIVDGFEGDKDDAVHRGCENGWKYAGLPWVQE